MIEKLKTSRNAQRWLLQFDEDVNLDAPITVIRVQPRFAGQNPLVLRKRFPKKLKEAVLSAFKKGVMNEDTGLTIGMSGRDFHEHLNTEGSVNIAAQIEAVAELPKLMRVAKLIKTYDDMEPSQGSNIEKMRKFVVAFNDSTADYSVVLTVKEFKGGTQRGAAENPVRLYHHRVEKKLTPASSTATPVEQAVSSTSSSADKYTIRRLLEGVKDSEGKTQGKGNSDED
jgi:hypothetical protein